MSGQTDGQICSYKRSVKCQSSMLLNNESLDDFSADKDISHNSPASEIIMYDRPGSNIGQGRLGT